MSQQALTQAKVRLQSLRRTASKSPGFDSQVEELKATEYSQPSLSVWASTLTIQSFTGFSIPESQGGVFELAQSCLAIVFIRWECLFPSRSIQRHDASQSVGRN